MVLNERQQLCYTFCSYKYAAVYMQRQECNGMYGVAENHVTFDTCSVMKKTPFIAMS